MNQKNNSLVLALAGLLLMAILVAVFRLPLADYAYKHAVEIGNRDPGRSRSDAIDFLEFTLLLDPKHANAWGALCSFYMDVKDPRAEAACRHQVELHPTEESYRSLGRFYGTNGRYRHAIEAYEQSLKIRPACLTYGMLAESWVSQSDVDAAVDVLERSILRNPRRPCTQLCEQLSGLLFARGRYESALEPLKCAAISPASLDPSGALIKLGYVHELRGEHSEALVVYGKAFPKGKVSSSFSCLPERGGSFAFRNCRNR